MAHRPAPPIRVRLWLRLGLAGNPFRRLHGAELVGSLLELNGPDDRAVIADWLSDDRDVLQFIGQEGWGKSTRLAACHHVAEAERRIPCRFDYIPLGARQVPVPPRGAPELRAYPQDSSRASCPGDRAASATRAIWLIDEVQRLSARCRRRLARWAARNQVRLLLGTHDDLADGLKRVGLTVQTVRLAPADETTIRRFIERRLAVSRLPDAQTGCRSPGPETGVTVTDSAVAALSEDARGNLGRVEYVLYEACQRAVEGLTGRADTSGDDTRTTSGPQPGLLIDAAAVRAAAQLVSAGS